MALKTRAQLLATWIKGFIPRQKDYADLFETIVIQGEAAASAHSHAISGVDGLQNVLDSKQTSGDYVTNIDLSVAVSGLEDRIDSLPVTGFVPETRTINGIPLSADITISASGGGSDEVVYKLDTDNYGLSNTYSVTVATTYELTGASGVKYNGEYALVTSTNKEWKYRVPEQQQWYTPWVPAGAPDYNNRITVQTTAEKNLLDLNAISNYTVIVVIEENSTYYLIQENNNELYLIANSIVIADIPTTQDLYNLTYQVFSNHIYVVTSENTGYTTPNGWIEVGTPFHYKYTIDVSGNIYNEGVFIGNGLDWATLGQSMGDWLHDSNTNIKYVWTTINGSSFWKNMGSKDWLVPMYRMGENNETKLYVYDGGINCITFHPKMNSLEEQPTGKNYTIQFDTGPDYLIIDFLNTNTNIAVHFFDIYPILPLKEKQGIVVRYGTILRLIQNRSIEDGDIDTQWALESCLFSRRNEFVDGWGNNIEYNIAGTLLQRFSLNQGQYQALTGDSLAGAQNADILHTHSSAGITGGASGSFTSQDGKTVTVTNGIITSIV